GSLAMAQLYHGGMRADAGLTGQQPVSASDNDRTGARALDKGEVERLIEDFVAAAIVSDRAGFDGVELHGAHGYILSQFLSARFNRRDDCYGGPLENRAHVIRAIILGIRQQCRADFILGLRLSPERYGMDLGEIR